MSAFQQLSVPCCVSNLACAARREVLAFPSFPCSAQHALNVQGPGEPLEDIEPYDYPERENPKPPSPQDWEETKAALTARGLHGLIEM